MQKDAQGLALSTNPRDALKEAHDGCGKDFKQAA